MQKDPIIIPPDTLSTDALQGIIEKFILREGTDYGEKEIEISRKIDSVKRQIDSGRAYIIFDPETETTTILAAHDPAFKKTFPSQKG
jgi:uncharacterized protein